MSTIISRAGLLALAALLPACGSSLPPSRVDAPPVVPPVTPPVDPDLPLPPKMRCAPDTTPAATLARTADCGEATEGQS